MKDWSKEYHRMTIQTGKRARVVFAPNAGLREKQRLFLAELMQRKTRPSPWSHSQRGRSHVTHAGEHAGQALVVTMDLADFFGHVTEEMVRKRVVGTVPDFCFLHGALPPGAPTSPLLADMAATTLDEALAKLGPAGSRYSRFVDDLAFSFFRTYSRAEVRAFIETVTDCCTHLGFPLNEKKTHVMPRWTRQEVCGYVVNLAPGRRPVRHDRKTWRTLRATVCNLEADVWQLWTGGDLHSWVVRLLEAQKLARLLDYCEPEKAKPYLERLAALEAWRSTRA